MTLSIFENISSGQFRSQTITLAPSRANEQATDGVVLREVYIECHIQVKSQLFPKTHVYAFSMKPISNVWLLNSHLK